MAGSVHFIFDSIKIGILPFSDDDKKSEIVKPQREAVLNLARALLGRFYPLLNTFQICKDGNRRPYLAAKHAEQLVVPDISISHTHNFVMVGLVDAGAIGVDIETRRRELDVRAMSRVCNTDEFTALDDLKDTPEDLRHKLLWCFKESYLKASRGKDFMEMKKSHLRVIEKDGRFSVEALQPLPVAIIDSGAVVSEAYVATWVVCGRNRI